MTAPRPRLLYIASFAWLAVTGGRFMAPFLEHQANYSDTLVGTALASQYAVYSLLGSVGGSWADSLELQFPNRGRAQVMFIGAALGSTSFLLHGMSLVFPTRQIFSSIEWHFGLRILWACSLAMVMPVLDGMTLAHLEKTNGMDPSDYGKERLYGEDTVRLLYFLFVIQARSTNIRIHSNRCSIVGGSESHDWTNCRSLWFCLILPLFHDCDGRVLYFDCNLRHGTRSGRMHIRRGTRY